MRVNSDSIGFFNNRLAARHCIAVAMTLIFFITSSFTSDSDRDLRSTQANLLIRQIGHLLLLQSGDSISRVLPVTEIKEGTFLLSFENTLVFSHDSLMALTQRLLPRTLFPSGYTVTVHDCLKDGIVYGYQVNNRSPDILPCGGRSQPVGCYTIEIALADLYKNAEQKNADISHVTEEPRAFRTFKVDDQKINPGPIAIGIPEVQSFNVGLQQLNPITAVITTEESRSITLDYPFISLVLSGMLVLVSVTLLIGRFGKGLAPVKNQDHFTVKESTPEMSVLGKFHFDVKDQRLLLENEVISLTDKECRILELLNENFSALISRETLMQKVWIDEGVITGRSLDMFVSKLRKKLSGDPDLRITNVHGKGYKLESVAVFPPLGTI